MHNISIDKCLHLRVYFDADCQYGWNFDEKEWTETPVSQFKLVCEDKHIVTVIYSLNFAGNSIGTLFFSIISDR